MKIDGTMTSFIKGKIKESGVKEMFLPQVDFDQLLVENGKPLKTFDKKKQKNVPTPEIMIGSTSVRTAKKDPKEAN